MSVAPGKVEVEVEAEAEAEVGVEAVVERGVGMVTIKVLISTYMRSWFWCGWLVLQ